ncbi:TonB-dependent receptor domain-containing protein [Chitinimonas sp.]|uniref:TonB-dependent receptor domain-containing protein n=1 Tax=Chitinimonas sp. TaxID=1934313 RepID=UPI002F95F5E5
MSSRKQHLLPFALTALAASLSGFAADAPKNDDTVVVTAARLPQLQREVIGDVTVLDRETLDHYRGESLADILPMQPGAQIISNGGPGKATSVFLRGTNAQHTLLLIDGVRYGSATLGSAAIQHLPLDQIERIEILRGPAASMYGADAIGGVIQVFTRKGSKAGEAAVEVGAGNQGTYALSANLGGEVDGTRYAVAVAHNKTDGVSAIANPKNSNYNPDRDGYRNTSLSASLSRKLDAANELGGSILLADEHNQYDSSYPSKNYDYRDQGVQGSATVWSRHQLSDAWTARLQAGLSEDNSANFGPVSATDLRDLKSEINTRQTQFSWQNDVKLGLGTATLGLETLQQKVSGDTVYDVSQRRINSVFGGYLARIGDATVQTNLRWDDNSQFGDHTSGTVGLSWQLAPSWQLGGSAGTGFRAPTFNELYYPGFGNAALKPEESVSTEAFARYKDGALSSSLTVYRNVVRDLLQYDPSTFSTGNIGKATLSGATWQAEWQQDAWLLGGHIDWLNARDSSGGSADGKQLARRARQAATVYGALNLGEVETRVEVQAQGKRWNNAGNTQRLAGYAVTNLSASWQVAPEWQLSARVNNVFDRDYTLVTDYGTVGRTALVSVRWQPK